MIKTLLKAKKSKNLAKSKKPEFVKATISETDFLIPKAKMALFHL